MLDIIKEGIKLNQCLVLLPLKAVRRLVNDKNTNTKQAIDVAEDFISIPFVAAGKALDNICQPCGQKPEAEGDCKIEKGPGVKNIWVNPNVSVFSDTAIKTGGRRTILTVTGLLCGG